MWMIWCTGSSARARALLSWACAPAAACGAVAADAGAGLGSLAAASVDVLPYWQGLQSGVAQLGVGQPGARLCLSVVQRVGVQNAKCANHCAPLCWGKSTWFI